MILFLFITVVYGLANLYVYLKLTSILESALLVNLLLGMFILLLALAPNLVYILSFRANKKLLTVYSYLGFMWVAFLSLFFPAAVLMDFYNLSATYVVPLFISNEGLRVLSSVQVVCIASGISAAVIIYGFFEAQNLVIERVAIKTDKLPEGMQKLTIAQISDLHLGLIVNDNMLDKVTRAIENEKPDLIVSTGDLIDGVVHHVAHLKGKLRTMHAGLGKFAVLGNHEIYGGLKHTSKFLIDAGFILLRSEATTIRNIINIAGMDFTGGEVKRNERIIQTNEESAVLSQLPRNIFTILLKHRSDIEEKSLGLFDLQLSGHTHKGQIFPMSLAIMCMFTYFSGFSRLPRGSSIYVSRGAGTAGPPVRFLSKPEVAIIELVSHEA